MSTINLPKIICSFSVAFFLIGRKIFFTKAAEASKETVAFPTIALIPAAFLKLGGFAVLAGKISLDKFNLFGSSPLSDYTWYFVASFAFLNLIVNAPKNFGLGGAAKDDISARIGFVGGAMIKRVMMVG